MSRANVRSGPRLACLSTLVASAALGVALAAGAADARAAFDPDLAVDPSGNANFVWERFDGTDNLLQERRRSTGGVLSDTQVLSAVGQDAFDPRVAVAPNGVATFVWARSNGTDRIAQTRSRTPDGALSAVQNLSAPGQDAIDAHVAVDANGRASFVWYRFNGANNIIQARRRLANGTLEAVQSISGSGQNAVGPQVAVAPTGAASFAWVRSNGTHSIAQSRRRLAGGTYEAALNLSAAGQGAGGPQVAVDPNGNASFVWHRSDGANTIVQTRRQLANGTLEATQDLSAVGRSAFEPEVAVDPDRNASFVWLGSNGANFIVQARRRLPNGTLEVTKDLSAAGQDAESSQVAVAPNGAATFAWRRSDGTNFVAQTRRRLANGSFGGVQDLSAPGVSADEVGVGVDNNDRATFVWERDGGVIQTRLRTGSFGPTVDLSN